MTSSSRRLRWQPIPTQIWLHSELPREEQRLGVVEVEETLDAGLEAAHRKFGEVLASGRTEALNVTIEACRNVCSVQSHFAVFFFSDVYLGVMKGGVVAHLSFVVSQSKPTRTPNDCLRTATRLVAEVACVWTDEADFMPQHDELAALLCAVTCEVNETEIDAAVEAFDHIDTDRLAAGNLVRTALNKNFGRPLREILKVRIGATRCGHQ